jgi:hypothetical protein
MWAEFLVVDRDMVFVVTNAVLRRHLTPHADARNAHAPGQVHHHGIRRHDHGGTGGQRPEIAQVGRAVGLNVRQLPAR